MEYQLQNFIDDALARGFTAAGVLSMDALIFLPEVRAMCAADKCRSFNKSWRCPPACGSIEDAAAMIKGYRAGIIVQTVGQMEDEFDFETVNETSDRHKSNFQKLYDDMRPLYPEILPMGAGTCQICEACTYPDAPCRFPDRAITSMEAYGLWVSKVCELSKIPYNYGPNTIAFTSCYILK